MRFSIVTPSFRQPDLLKLCIASVADQQVEVEHIVQQKTLDDGTMDWLRSDKRIKAGFDDDSGMYDALNRGFRRGSGDIFAWLNCDEQYLPGVLQKVAKQFEANPGMELLFAHAIVVDTEGHYMFHRKVVRPLVGHSWTCPLGTLSCAMFFRGSIVRERNLMMDPNWRYCGDAEWLVRVLRQKVEVGVLDEFTSVYARTETNLSGTPKADAESARFFATAPAILRLLSRVLVAHHRLRRLWHGIYFQKPFSYSIYTRQCPQARVEFRAEKPSGFWKS